jgi:hypothetical protein
VVRLSSGLIPKSVTTAQSNRELIKAFAYTKIRKGKTFKKLKS